VAEYLPFAEKHSIQEAQINLLFPSNFEQQSITTARGVAQAELSDSLPRLAEVRGGAIQIDISNPDAPVPGNISSDIIGFQFAKVQGNAQPAQTITLSGNVLSVSFFDYETWIQTRQATSEYISTVLSALPLVQNPVIALGLRFIDRYTFDGLPDQAQAELLMSQQSPYVAPHVFSAGSAWHCNTGWFDQNTEDRILHNLNMASNLVDLSSTVTIDHQATVHLRAPRQSTQTLFTPPGEESGLMQALDRLHEQNKEILKEILLPTMLTKIGLTP
jgi:uncharacterized protein (TIGR04255 family)